MTTDQLKKANELASKIEKQEGFVRIAEVLASNGDSVNTYACLRIPAENFALETYLDKESCQEINKKILEASKKKLNQLKEEFSNL
jgi:hypothetical protein